ncbi:MAG: HAMP domain-containing protein, partial [Chitinivibrionia bacterium]|nr:HAMP domain-containing protein [Chitinivibrionia bacterium]
ESSSDELPVGITLPADKIQKAKGLRWPQLSLPGGPCRFMVSDTEESGITLLAGFKTPTPLWHGLRWSTLLSLHMLFSFGIIVLIVMLKQVPPFRKVLPTLTQVRRLEFQQKLLASFLATALVPAIILGLFSVQMIKNRFIEENREEALSKAFGAKKALVNMLREEFKIISGSMDVGALAAGETESHFIMGDDGLLILYAGADNAALHSRDELFVKHDGDDAYIGVFGKPFTVERNGYPSEHYIYFGRRLGSDLLGEVADQVGADINVYYRGQLAASSREGLLASGLVNALMNTNAFVKVSLLGVDHALATERAGRYNYQVAYLPLESADTAEAAALSLPLLFQAESYLLEVRKATAVVFGIFALLFAATIGLGLVLARGIFEPLRYLLEGTKRIARGELTYKLPLKRHDEIGIVMEAFNDMTDKLADSQTALEERKRYLEAILANVGTGVISTDADGRIVTLNSAAERILGVDAHGVIGTVPERIVQTGTAPEFFLALQASSRSRDPFLSSEFAITKDGRRRTIKYMHTKLTLDDRYLGTVFVFEDLTELINSKKLSAWLEMSRQIAHEIKNPLTPIKLSTQFMKKAYDQRSPDFERIFKESSDTIIHQVDVLKRIAGEFSSFGKMQQLAVKANPLAPLIESIIVPYTQNTSSVDVSLSLSPRDMIVMADAEAFRKICTNLIENALEAMPDGGTLSIIGEETREEGVRFLRLSFFDTGPGLSEAANEKLFEPYFSTKTTGTGLGLAICRSLSREMGGDVTVENCSGATGAVATLALPLA